MSFDRIFIEGGSGDEKTDDYTLIRCEKHMNYRVNINYYPRFEVELKIL